MLEKIQDIPGLVKNTENKSVLNVDNEGLKSYRQRRSKAKSQEQAINKLEEEMKEVKGMLVAILKGLGLDG